MTTEAATVPLETFRRQVHCNCIICSPDNERGLKVHFEPAEEGSVEATFDCDRIFEGYPHTLHGGVISSLMDGAMVHALFARGIAAVTAEMTVRFRHPVATGNRATVRARVARLKPPLYLVDANLVQDRTVKVSAHGKFFGRTDGAYVPV